MAASQATNRPRIGLLDQLEIKWNTAIRSQTWHERMNDPAFNLDFKNGFFRQTIVSSYFSIYKTELVDDWRHHDRGSEYLSATFIVSSYARMIIIV